MCRGFACLSPIDQTVELLRNGEWHEIEEIANRTKLIKFKLELIVNFLVEYNFIELDDEGEKIRLTPSSLSFLKRIQIVENSNEYCLSNSE